MRLSSRLIKTGPKLDIKNLPYDWNSEANTDFKETKELNEKLRRFLKNSSTYLSNTKRGLLAKKENDKESLKRFYDQKTKLMYFKSVFIRNKGDTIKVITERGELEELLSIYLDYSAIKGKTNCTYLCEGKKCSEYLNAECSNMKIEHAVATTYHNKLNLCSQCHTDEKIKTFK